MKKIATAAALIAAIALSGAASGQAAGSSYEGGAERGAPVLNIEFVVVLVDGKPVRIRNFEFSGLRAECDGGGIAYVRGSIDRIRVRDDRTFAKTVERNGRRIRVTGKVRRNGVVPGTIRASGTFGERTGCNSGLVEWVARPPE